MLLCTSFRGEGRIFFCSYLFRAAVIIYFGQFLSGRSKVVEINGVLVVAKMSISNPAR